MANSTTHSAFEQPIRGARFTVGVPYVNPDSGTPAFDTEVSKDGGAFADATEELTDITGVSLAGVAWMTLSGAETDCSLLIVQFKTALLDQPPTIQILRPQALPIIASGTATAGAATTITFASVAHAIPGCLVKTTGGTGGGGAGGANNQVRRIKSVSGAVATVDAWETNPDATTTYEVLLPLGAVADADSLLLRNVSNVEAVAPKDCLLTAILAMLHNSLVPSPGNLRIFRTNGTTTHFDIPVTSDAGANPLTSLN